jgi:hypothetical protein
LPSITYRLVRRAARFFFRVIGKNYYSQVPLGLLALNWIVQRVFRRSSEFPFSVHFTSWAAGYKGLILPENSESIKLSFAESGGCFISIADDTNLRIGEGTLWGSNVCIQTLNHDHYDRKKYIKKSIEIGKNCWLGSSVTICPGVVLGDNITVGANTVVTKSFPSSVLIGGCPARIIKNL